MQPRKHHYIPAFYLKRWTGADGRLCEFSQPYRAVVPFRKFPAATGYADRLYELRGFPAGLAQQVEERFFKTVDNGASAALEMMEREGNDANWTVEQRSAWSRFIVSLLTRCPEDIDWFRRRWTATMDRVDPEMERRYAAARESDDPPTMAEFIAQEPLELKEKSLFEAYMKLVDNPNIGAKLNAMHWHLLELPNEDFKLLTSDRPVIRTNGLLAPNGHLALPIGPRRLFVAAPDIETVRRFVRASRSGLAKHANATVVGAAVKFVYAMDDSQLRFVQNRFSTNPEPRLLELAARRDPPPPSKLLTLPVDVVGN